MKIPNLFPRKLPTFRMPTMRPKQNQRLQATARRATRDSSDDTEEPNMKLSSAFVVVLVLHVVAVGGIYAFNSIKAHRAPSVDPTYRPSVKTPPAPQTDAAPSSADTAPALLTAAHATNAGASNVRIHKVKNGDTVARIAADNHVTVDDLEEANGLKNANALRIGQELKVPLVPAEPAKPAERKPAGSPAKPSAMVRDSGLTHTVAKGDNPVAIARKYGVPYDDLLKINKIDDARKLKIGTKLRLPAKTKSKP